MPDDKMPEYIMKGTAGPVINDEAEVVRVRRALSKELGEEKILEGIPPVMISEDFPMLASPFPDVPTLFVEIGTGEPDAYANFIERAQHPAVLNHNPRYTVDIGAIEVGTVALTTVVREYLGD